MKDIKITWQSSPEQAIKALKHIHGGYPIAMSNSVNAVANVLDYKYRASLRLFNLKNKFTMGSVKKMLSRPKRSSGEFRKIEDINAIVGVRKMKGGREHYLLRQEQGDITRGYSETFNKVAVPLDAARMSGSPNKPIKGALRLGTLEVQTLNIGGQQLGVNDNFTPAQRWAILHKYKKNNRYGWNLRKPFVFRGMKLGLGIFFAQGAGFTMARMLDKGMITIKPTKKFQIAFDSTATPKMLETSFVREVMKMER